MELICYQQPNKHKQFISLLLLVVVVVAAAAVVFVCVCSFSILSVAYIFRTTPRPSFMPEAPKVSGLW